MRRASISASLSDKQDVEGHIPSLKQSSFYSASESSHKGISHDDGSRVYRPTSEAHVTRHLSSGSNGSDVSQTLSETHQVPNDQVPLNNNGDKSKKDLILSLRQLAEVSKFAAYNHLSSHLNVCPFVVLCWSSL